MEADSGFYERALARTRRHMLFLGAAGTLGAVFFKGWVFAFAFLLGAAGSWFNFSWLHQAVEAMGPGARPTRKRVFVFLALRYLLLGAGAYVIVKVFGMNAIAALCGVFVPVAAVVLEILYELVHGT